jgi:hypothetical protein
LVSHWLNGWAKEPAGEAASGTGAKETTGRFQLDYAAWHARLAAPSSRFGPARSAPPRIVRVDTATRPAAAADAERRTA